MKVYDLSLPFSRNMPTYSMDLAYYNPPMIGSYAEWGETVLEKKTGRTAGFDCMETVITFYSHTGTHFDAPLHYNKNGWAIHEVPLDRMCGEGVVVSIPKGELEEIGPEDFEKATPKIQKGDIVVVNTGWHKKYCGPMDDYEKACYYAKNNPGVTKEGADWLIKKGIKTLLVDYIGVDHVKYTERGDNTMPVHRNLLANNIPMVQILDGQIDEVTGKRCLIVCAPVNLVGGDAFPVRVLAIVQE